jgi:hypothetical protein
MGDRALRRERFSNLASQIVKDFGLAPGESGRQ